MCQEEYQNECHSELLFLIKHVYTSSAFIIQNLKLENESSDYGAAEFTINNQLIKFRVGKITPTKKGQFVTFWKRISKGPIEPYHITDSFDLFVVSVRNGNRFGQFVFPKKILCEKGIVSTDEKEGKRAMRVYPPWDKADNPQAKKTQAWQLEWFVEIPETLNIDLSRVYHARCQDHK